MSKSRLDKVLDQMPSHSDMGNEDLKTLIAEFIMDQQDDDVEKKRGTRSRLKLDALKLLAEIIKNESGGDINDAILGIIAGKSSDE
jgi:hypothetical protein